MSNRDTILRMQHYFGSVNDLANFDACVLIITTEAKNLNTLALKECNGITCADGSQRWTEADQENNDKLRALDEKLIVRAFRTLWPDTMHKMIIEFQADPRGPSVIIHEKDGAQYVGAFK